MSSIAERRRKKRNSISKIWVSCITIIAVLVFAVQTIELRADAQEYQERKASLEKQLEKENQRKDDLVQEEKYRQTMKYVEDYAHDRLGLVYPGEIIFKAEE